MIAEIVAETGLLPSEFEEREEVFSKLAEEAHTDSLIDSGVLGTEPECDFSFQP